MRTADIMTTRTFTIDSSATVAEAIGLMQDNKVRSLIVKPSEDRAYGIVTETDIIYKVATKYIDPKTVMVYQIMTKPCIAIDPNLNLKNVAQLFAKIETSPAPVIQEHLLKIISVTDLLIKSNTSSRFANSILGVANLKDDIFNVTVQSCVAFAPA